MRFVKALSILMVLLSVLVVAAAQAAPGGKSARQAPAAQTLFARDLIVESEPNDNCATADPISVGEVMNAAIDPLEDNDFFKLILTEAVDLYIHTILGEDPPDLPDSELYLFADDCVTVLGYCDDSIGLESAIICRFAGAGTYYIMVMGYADNNEGEYQLAIEEITIAPVGDICEDATSIPNGEFTFTASTTGMDDDYAVYGYGEDAPDGVFGFTLPHNAIFTCQFDIVGADLVIALVTDCSDPDGSCVDFSDDDPEYIDYTNGTGDSQLIYLIVDGYGEGDQGGFVMSGFNEGSGLVAVTPMSWGEVKARYSLSTAP